MTTIFINGALVSVSNDDDDLPSSDRHFFPPFPKAFESVKARIVKYKKHKRPNHFNFWITGLQKTLAPYNDVRQAGVAWEGEGHLRVNLVAA